MARFGKRTVLLVLVAIMILSIILRYPMVEHERHNDTYFIHLLSESIQKNDYAIWTFHPLSYFGLYPASYPSGSPFLLAEFSELSGIQTPLAILVEGMIFSILFTFTAFCVARQFLNRQELVLLVTLFAATAPRFVDTSYWNASARAPFVVLALLAVFVAFRAASTRQLSLYPVLALAVFGCFTVHHMAVLFVLFGLAYILSASLLYVIRRNSASPVVANHKRVVASAFVAALAITITTISLMFLSYFTKSLRTDFFQETSLFSTDPEFISIILNVSASYTNQIGFILVFGLLGIPAILRYSRIDAESMYPVVLLFVFIPLLPNALYVTMVVAPFVAVLGVWWIGIQLQRGKKILATAVVITLAVSSIALPLWSVDRWNDSTELSGDPVEVDNQVFNDGAYLSEYGDKTNAISNVDIESRRLSAISGTVFLWSGVEAALSGDMTADSIAENIVWTQETFPKNLYLWFDPENDPNVDMKVIFFVMQGIEYASGPSDQMYDDNISLQYYDYYHPKLLVVIDNRWSSEYVWVWAILPAKLPSQLRNAQTEGGSLDSYSIYQSERITLYALGIPFD